MHLWRLEWSAFEAASKALADALCEEGEFDGIVAVARGGLPLGERLAEHLRLPLVSVTARANASDAIGSAPLPVLELDPSPLRHLTGSRRAIVCDDIVGSGATITAVKRALAATTGIADPVTVTLCQNAGARLSPDIWIWTVRDWVMFPWEDAGLPDRVKAKELSVAPVRRARR
jgi:uncharacterized protein